MPMTVRGEPFDSPFVLRLSKDERLAQPPAQRASGSERTGLSNHERHPSTGSGGADELFMLFMRRP
jgi:hypothetical protein